MSYGRVVDIVALKTMKMRGQAFIVFEDQVASALALKSLQGFSFFGKPLRISYSKSISKSDPDFVLFQQEEKEDGHFDKKRKIDFSDDVSANTQPESQESDDSEGDKSDH
ncbi:hypothetical protein MDAP_000054 [Mitosporidium daphniae]